MEAPMDGKMLVFQGEDFIALDVREDYNRARQLYFLV